MKWCREIGDSPHATPMLAFFLAAECGSRAVADTFDSRSAWPNCLTSVSDAGGAQPILDSFSIKRCVQGADLRPRLYSHHYLQSCAGEASVFAMQRFLVNTGVPYLGCVASPAASCPITCDSGEALSLTKGTKVVLLPRRKFEETLVDSGPIVVQMTVYADLAAYTGGIYKHQTETVVGTALVQIVAYDETTWTLKGSFGPDWGEQGFFKVNKDQNESDIEKGTYIVVVV